MKILLTLFCVILTNCAAPREKPRLGVLPAVNGPLCTDRTRSAVGEDECVRRLTAFAGRAMHATVVVSARNAPRPGEQAAEPAVGAGVIVDADGRVFTAYHVVRGMTEITAISRQVGGADGRLVYGDMPGVPMTVAAYAERLDLALLEPVTPGRLPGPITVDRMVRSFSAGQKVWLFGSRAVGYGGYVTTGVTETVQLPNGELRPDLIEVGVPVVGRDLGGPVLSAAGDVVGIMVVADEKNKRAFFIPVSIAVQLFGLTWITEVPL